MTTNLSSDALSTLFETLPVGVTFLDADGRITRANERAEDVLGLTSSEITGRTYDDPAWEIVDELGGPIPREELPFARTRATGEPVFDYEHGIRWPDGSERWLSINAAPLSPKRGDPKEVVAVITDITQRRAHDRTIEEQNERLAEFASIVSHDLRNPLNVLQGYLDLAQESGDPEQFARCRTAAERMEKLITDLLVLAREGSDNADVQTVSVPELATECWSFVSTAEARLSVETDARIRGDRNRLQQLFENLFRNAVEHGGSDVTVRVGPLADASGIYVEDDGVGIPAEARRRIFSEAPSTAERGRRFGLKIVRQIVDAHGWGITATESATGGARFEIAGIDFVDPTDAA